MKPVELQRAYILHTRPYRDTSLLVDFLTVDFGRVSAVVRGVRQRKGSKRQLFNPFQRLLISWQGNSSLKLLTAFESDNVSIPLVGTGLYSGFYLNELLMRLLQEMDPHSEVFDAYQLCLIGLRNAQELEPVLREFEFRLLSELGYGLDFTHDALTQEAVRGDRLYRCDTQEGFSKCMPGSPANLVFDGSCLLAIAAGDYSAPETRQSAKRLTRMLLKPLLGSRPLKSRELFSALKS